MNARPDPLEGDPPMTAAQDLADALGEVADHHDQDCPKREGWVRLADHVGRECVATVPATEVTR